ncbi:hypothetical protein RHMOL_Rhmol02G0041600 [Rhododendron molle]|uniref:Uncharacterized protein n=1 Tax=Rhododendron molle TaxID=49168 RepID=A0ACC0PL92_RHOML|nr:hypothetical protein RHMOL_Rhmol02G0041600 [Rhododendron molle]
MLPIFPNVGCGTSQSLTKRTGKIDNCVSQSALKHKLLSQSHPNETPAVVDQEGILQLNSNTLPSDQAMAATVDTNSVVAMKILPLQFSLTAQQESTDEDFTEDGQVNFGCVGKGERKEKTPGGDRGKKKTTGVGISIPLEDILQPKGMSLKDAAKHLNGMQSQTYFSEKRKKICSCFFLLDRLFS